MNEKSFCIAGIPFVIRSNLSEEVLNKMFGEPQPFNLFINYDVEVGLESDSISNPEVIYIRDSKNNYSAEHFSDGLRISIDVNELLQRDYNWQFSIFGNKGIVQNYILHIMEKKYKRVIFHGCAVRNQHNGSVIIGLGQSGAGKSAFVSTALRNGWELIATEQVMLDDKMNIFRGNVFDNISPLSVEIIKTWLPDANIIEHKRLVEPTGQKIFVDMRNYVSQKRLYSILLDKLCIVNLNFHGKDFGAVHIDDSDYFLRLLQICASEKISSPTIIRNKLVNIILSGDIDFRQHLIEKIIDSKAERIILSGGFEGFEKYLAIK